MWHWEIEMICPHTPPIVSCQVIEGLMGMATLAVEHARRKHAAQLAIVFSDLLQVVSLLRCKLASEALQSDAEMKTFTEGLKTQLHAFYTQARSLSQRNAHTTRVDSCLCWGFPGRSDFTTAAHTVAARVSRQRRR